MNEELVTVATFLVGAEAEMARGLLESCGIEVFKVENGRLTDCWNTPYAEGHWA